MRLSNLTLVIVIVLASCDTANNVDPRYKENFVRYYGSAGAQSGADVLVDADGSMFLLGNSVAPTGVFTGFIIKVDRFGNVITQRQLGGPNENAADVEFIRGGNNDGDLVVVNNVGPEASSNIRVIRLSGRDLQGIDSVLVIPSGSLVNGMKRVARSITSLTNGQGFIVTGYADKDLTAETNPVDATTDQRDLLAIRINENLDMITSAMSVGGEQNGSLINAFEVPSDSLPLVMFGYSDKPVSAAFELNYTFYLPDSDILAAGASVGSATQEEELASVAAREDGKFFLLAGTSRAAGASSGDIYLVKYGYSFDMKMLDKRVELNRNLVCVDADFSSGSNYVVLANEVSSDNLNDIFLVKVDRRGEPIWTRTFGTDGGDDTAAAIATLPDGRIVVLGTIELETNKKLSLFVLNNRGEL